MHYNFDEIIERHGTGCVKHDVIESLYGSKDLLAMWVADMDFRSPDFVMEAIRRRADHEVLGYAYATDHYYDTMRAWLRNHYGIEATRQELHFIPGIVSGIAFVLQAFSQPGDRILILTPVYPPFINLPHGSGRIVVQSPLKIVDGRFAIDFDDLEKKAVGCKVMILSNPHNPGGTIWSREELRRVADICARHKVLTIADEIHADLSLAGRKHVSFPTASAEAAENCIMFFSPSKTFNIAGLSSSVAYVPNEELRRRYFGYLNTYEVANGNIFAYVGAEAAFAHGEEWLAQMLQYLQGNVTLLDEFLRQEMPKIKAVLPEASYLAWLDFNGYGFSHQETWQRLIERGHILLNDGTTFGGKEYENCFRLNIGCPRATLTEALRRIKTAMEDK